MRTVYRTTEVATLGTEDKMDDSHSATGVADYQASEGEQIIEITIHAVGDGAAAGQLLGSVQLRGDAMPEVATFGAGGNGAGSTPAGSDLDGGMVRYDLRDEPIILKAGALEMFANTRGGGENDLQVSATLLIARSGAVSRAGVAVGTRLR